jgi:hypothetical protein
LKQLATYTMVFSLAAIFLLSFTGMRMLIHHCLSCETTDILLFAYSANQCASVHHNHHDHNDNAVCHINLNHDEAIACCEGDGVLDHNSCENCCKTEFHYLKNDYDVYQERSEQRIEPVVVAVLVNFFVPVVDDELSTGHSFNQYTNTDPPQPVGRDFIIYTHQLKVA